MTRIFYLLIFCIAAIGCRKEIDPTLDGSNYLHTFDLYPNEVYETKDGFIIEAYQYVSELSKSIDTTYIKINDNGQLLWKINRSEIIHETGLIYCWINHISVSEDEFYVISSGYKDTINYSYVYQLGKIENGNYSILNDSLGEGSYSTTFYPVDLRQLPNGAVLVAVHETEYDTTDWWTIDERLHLLSVDESEQTILATLSLDDIDGFYALDDIQIHNGNIYLLIEGLEPMYLVKVNASNEHEWTINFNETGPLAGRMDWNFGDLGIRDNTMSYMFNTWSLYEYKPSSGNNEVVQKSVGNYKISESGSILSVDTIVGKGIFNNKRKSSNHDELFACGNVAESEFLDYTPYISIYGSDGNVQTIYPQDKKGMQILNAKKQPDGSYLALGSFRRFKGSIVEDLFITNIKP